MLRLALPYKSLCRLGTSYLNLPLMLLYFIWLSPLSKVILIIFNTVVFKWLNGAIALRTLANVWTHLEFLNAPCCFASVVLFTTFFAFCEDMLNHKWTVLLELHLCSRSVWSNCGCEDFNVTWRTFKLTAVLEGNCISFYALLNWLLWMCFLHCLKETSTHILVFKWYFMYIGGKMSLR